jgi:hypothetical protein
MTASYPQTKNEALISLIEWGLKNGWDPETIAREAFVSRAKVNVIVAEVMARHGIVHGIDPTRRDAAYLAWAKARIGAHKARLE